MSEGGELDQDVQQVFEIAETALDIERKYGPVRRIASAIFHRKSNTRPVKQIDYRAEAAKAALENAVDKIASQELTIDHAFQIVGGVVSFDDLDKLNSTWQSHWSEGASKVGIDDEERRTWWARLLAGEIQQPGTFSLRTIAVMNTLSTDEAQLFTRLCDYVWNPGNPVLILPADDSELWKPDFDEATIVDTIGLCKFDSLPGFRMSAIDATKSVGMMFNDRAFLISSPTGESVKLRCGLLLLTDVGKEMYRLTTPVRSQSYCDEILAEWRQSYTVHQLSKSNTVNEFEHQ